VGCGKLGACSGLTGTKQSISLSGGFDFLPREPLKVVKNAQGVASAVGK